MSDDYRAIDAGMSTCSKFEHNAAMRMGRLQFPHPDELSEDIERLASRRHAILERGEQLRAAMS